MNEKKKENESCDDLQFEQATERVLEVDFTVCP